MARAMFEHQIISGVDEFLAFVDAFIEEHEYAPTYREMADYFEVSRGAITYWINRCRQMNLMRENEPRKPRTLVLTTEGRETARRYRRKRENR